MTNAESLKDKVAIVTGASSGIGEAVAYKLAAAGAKVALLARRMDLIEKVAATIKSAGGEALPLGCDVSSYPSVAAAVETVEQTWKRVDILVNNAGVMYLGSVSNAQVEDWQKMININVLGLMYCTRAALAPLKKRGGDIVNISSVSGRVVTDRSAAYSATKFAVNGFSEGLRQELYKDKVRVTLVEPGAVLTELANHIPDASLQAKIKSWVASMTALNSEDIANAVVYAVTQPPHVSVNELMIRPTEQAL